MLNFLATKIRTPRSFDERFPNISLAPFGTLSKRTIVRSSICLNAPCVHDDIDRTNNYRLYSTFVHQPVCNKSNNTRGGYSIIRTRTVLRGIVRPVLFHIKITSVTDSVGPWKTSQMRRYRSWTLKKNDGDTQTTQPSRNTDVISNGATCVNIILEVIETFRKKKHKDEKQNKYVVKHRSKPIRFQLAVR